MNTRYTKGLHRDIEVVYRKIETTLIIDKPFAFLSSITIISIVFL